MICQACGWKSPNVKAITFCPNCGDNHALESYPHPVNNPVDNYNAIS